MHSSRPSVPPRPRRFDSGRRAEAKTPNHMARREDKNINSSPRRVTRGPPEPSRLKGTGPRSTATQPKLVRQQKNSIQPVSGNSVPKVGRAAPNLGHAAEDPNCNEPSLPCLCCDGHSLQDSNSLFNHNHNNNNTVAVRPQLKLAPVPHKDEEAEKMPEIEQKAKCKPEEKQPVVIPVANQVGDGEEENGNAEEKKEAIHKEDDAGANVNGKVDENGNDENSVAAPDDPVAADVVPDENDADDDDEDDDDDNTLVPSCCDCPASMLDFSLTSSTSSSSTSISSCSDLESDCPDTFSVSQQEQEHYSQPHSPAPNVFQPCSLPLDLNTSVRPSPSPCSPDEGYPSAPLSPSSDFMESKVSDEEKAVKVDLLNFLDSIDELGKVDRFYRIVQVARWELEGDFDLRDRLVHQERLEKVNKQVKLVHLERLQDTGLDLDEDDLSGMLDEMGNIEISWKLYKSDKSCDSQEYSDAGVDMTAPSDLDEPSAPDSLVPSPVDPPPRPPKPPARHISAHPELHTYMNISGNTPSVSSTSSPVKSFSLSVSASLPSSSASVPPALPPPPSQSVPYFTLYSDSPSCPSPTPPIPPPRRRHKARLEAQRLAELEKERTTQSLPAPTSRPPPLPPPPVIQPSPPAIPPPPSLPPPPSFHALDVEIRKLLALAGITQAELLRLSPELGVCVDGILEEGEISEISKANKEERGEMDKGCEFTWRDELRGNKLGKDVKELDAVNKEEASVDVKKEGSKDTFKTTSFTEIARRRKRNGGSGNSSCNCSLGDDASLTADLYYSTDISNKQLTDVSFCNFDYASVIPDSPPPPPPPRPLPPRPQIFSNPPELPPLKPCTLPANASRPDRFDWLIAFTPDSETPPLGNKKSSTDAVPQKTSGPKVTTFKELRNKGKQASPPTQVQPEPEPTAITPDPDFLYNLKWRREKVDGDGTQWEYTSQAQATFLQPPPTPASLALFREMRQLNIQGEASLEPNAMQQNACLAKRHDTCDFADDQKKGQKEDEEEKTEVRGMADGGRTWESRKIVPSPPLSLASPQVLHSPYFLHSKPPSQPPLFYRYDFYRSQSKAFPFPQVSRIPTDSIRDTYPDSLYRMDAENSGEFLCPHKNPSSGNNYSSSGSIIDSLYQCSQYSNSKKDSIYAKDPHVSNFSSLDANCFDPNCNVDSLYCGEKYRPKTLKLADFDKPCSEGNTTPYKNIDVINYINAGKLNDSSEDALEDITSWFDTTYGNAGIPAGFDQNDDGKKVENGPSFPTLYLYHPKNCPMHKGALPRLSPIGAISPPHRAGPLSPGADVSRLSSPLFPRSHTLPALAAPLYYPYLYTPRAQAPQPELKLHSQQRPSPPLSLTVRSLSFAGSAAKGVWMGSDVRSPLKGDGLSSLCLQEKRALVSVVSVAVEAILAQFSSSRTLVQKALSGDSSVNPTLGRLVLQCLCPALRDLLSDGLKPHQSDLIAGRRPNSPWSLVQASTKAGLSTQALHNLQVKVAALPQLKHSRHRFNSFLLGLLNIKRLDFWLSHLQSCSDVLETYYRPTAFMRLSATACQPLFEELLLLLQPLSLLTFNLDLLFQHHHLDPSSPALTPPSQSPGTSRAPNRGFSFHLLPTYHSDSSGGHLKSISKQEPADLGCFKASAHCASPTGLLNSGPVPCRPAVAVNKGETSPQLQWLKEKEIGAPPSDGSGSSLTQQAGQAIQQGWGAVMRWGERFGQNLGGLTSLGSSEEAKGAENPNTCSDSEVQRSPGQDVLPAYGVPWGLGRLFGASKSPNIQPSKRRPSQWLSPGITVLTRMTSAGQAFLPEKTDVVRKVEDEKEKEESCDQPKPLRAVRTLCDHTGTGAELSFRKGEELIILGGVDQDWIRCRQGDKEGLVPIGYASLII